MLLRVQKILADAGIASRRKCEQLIRESRVKVNGKVIKLGDKADSDKDKIYVDNKLIVQRENKIYILLNKPWGYVTTVSEPFGMRKVADLVALKERIYPVGRLDKYSEGLLLLTNDGELANKLTHPSFGVSKIYVVKLAQEIRDEDLAQLLGGIKIEGREVALEKLTMLSPTKLEVKIHEGRKHIVRRLFEELGYRVTKLTRVAFGPLKLGNLKKGKWRYLSGEEIKRLITNDAKQRPKI